MADRISNSRVGLTADGIKSSGVNADTSNCRQEKHTSRVGHTADRKKHQHGRSHCRQEKNTGRVGHTADREKTPAG